MTGADLLVVPGFVAHDTTPGDLQLRRRNTHAGLAPGAREAFDADVVVGRENVAQALILRLLTPRGALAALGHSAYGSRLHELVGERKTPALRGLCRTFVLEAVAQEPRVDDRVVAFDFDLLAETADSFAFTLAVTSRGGEPPVSLALEVAI